MKKIIVPICVTISLMTQSFASGTSTLLEQVRAEKVELFKNNLDAIVNRVNSYILNSGDIDITRKKVQKFDGLPYQFFNNFQNVSCTNDGEFCGGQTGTDGIQVSLTEKSIVLKNTLGANPNSYVKKAFTTNNDNSRAISTADNYTVTFPLDSKTKNFIAFIDKIKDNSDIHIGSEPPSDTLKIWYFPNGNGGFDIKIWNSTTNKWENVGSTSNNGETSIHASSEEELLEIPCVKNDKAFVINKATATEYLCSQDGEWAMVLGGSSAFNGASDMLNLVTKLMKKTGGSVADVSDPNIASAKQAFAGNQSFTKKDNTANNGYWTATDKTTGVEYIATDTYETLKTINSIDGSYAFLPNMKKDGVDTLIRYQNRWLYLANGYMEIVSYFKFVPEDGFATIKNVGTGYKIDGEGQFFKRVGNYFVSQSDVSTEDYKVMMTLSDRNTLNSSSGHQVYLVANNDCTSDSCNGNAVNDYYAGKKIENMFVFYYSTSGKNKNNLTDATPIDTIAGIYSAGGSAYILTSNSGDALEGDVILKKSEPVNGEDCYMVGGKIILQSGQIIPSHLDNNILSYTCKTVAGKTMASVTGANDLTRALNVSSIHEFLNMTNLPIGYKVNFSSSTEGITGVLERCTDSGETGYSIGQAVWSDNCFNMASANYALTNGSRSDLIAPNSSSRINLTLDVGGEANYSINGVAYAKASNMYQWFYSSSGGITTNDMLDVVIPTATYTSTNGNGSFGYTQGVTKNAYLDMDAKNTGVALLNGIVARLDNGLWKPINDNTKVLSGDFKVQVNATDIGGVSGNGLIYTGTSAPFGYYIFSYEFDVTPWSPGSSDVMNSVNPRGNSTNICESRGMLLPLLSETAGTLNPWGDLNNVPSGGSMGNSNGVPSHPSGTTWTSTAYTGNTSLYWKWAGSGTDYGPYNGGNYVRCVR